MVIHMAHSPWLALSTFYFFLFLLSVPVFLFHLELFPELHYTKDMANLRRSATNESEDTSDVFITSTGYEPKAHDFDELYDSSVPFSLMIPSTDQDVDDLTLGEMLTAAYRGQVDYCVPGGMSVSQSSSSVMFDGSGQLDGERMVDRSGQPDVTFNVMELTATFLKISELSEFTIDQGNLMSVTARTHRLGLYLKSKDRRISRNIAKKSVITNSKQLQAAHAEEERRLLQGQLWQQKLEFREARQQSLTEMEELQKFQSSAFDTMARRKLIEDQNTVLELSGRVQELQNEVNCMNDTEDFQDAESFRIGNSHVASRPVSFPPHPIPEGMLRHSFVSPSRKEGPPSILGHTWFFGKRFCKSTCVSTLSSRIASMEFVNRRAAPFIHSGEK